VKGVGGCCEDVLRHERFPIVTQPLAASTEAIYYSVGVNIAPITEAEYSFPNLRKQ
jgi:hypothetical protein